MCCCEVVRGSTSYEVKFSAFLQHDKNLHVSLCVVYVCGLSVCVTMPLHSCSCEDIFVQECVVVRL